MKLKYLLLGLALFVNHTSMGSEIVRVNQKEFIDLLFEKKTARLDIAKNCKFEAKIDKDEKESVRGEIKNGVLVFEDSFSDKFSKILIWKSYNKKTVPDIPSVVKNSKVKYRVDNIVTSLILSLQKDAWTKDFWAEFANSLFKDRFGAEYGQTILDPKKYRDYNLTLNTYRTEYDLRIRMDMLNYLYKFPDRLKNYIDAGVFKNDDGTIDVYELHRVVDYNIRNCCSLTQEVCNVLNKTSPSECDGTFFSLMRHINFQSYYEETFLDSVMKMDSALIKIVTEFGPQGKTSFETNSTLWKALNSSDPQQKDIGAKALLLHAFFSIDKVEKDGSQQPSIFKTLNYITMFRWISHIKTDNKGGNRHIFNDGEEIPEGFSKSYWLLNKGVNLMKFYEAMFEYVEENLLKFKIVDLSLSEQSDKKSVVIEQSDKKSVVIDLKCNSDALKKNGIVKEAMASVYKDGTFEEHVHADGIRFVLRMDAPMVVSLVTAFPIKIERGVAAFPHADKKGNRPYESAIQKTLGDWIKFWEN